MSSGSSGDAYAEDAFEDDEQDLNINDGPIDAHAGDGYSDDDFELDEVPTASLDNPLGVNVVVPLLHDEELQPSCRTRAPPTLPALNTFVVAKLRRLHATPVDTRLQVPVPAALLARLGRPRSLFTYTAYHTSRLQDQAWASQVDALYARRPDPLAIAAAAMSALRPAYAPLDPT
ncbi:hypothetical protein SDRG_02026 [Saprolegnia diclina VS20]|uniref:Uncharacterized protein n=1 Tax=Saprolegnia diclina (strain VS20) TaxID=1156394 RepID=T0S7E2_SAPDV|nr:hypothetical protein SDRG_02026 [Saprolegnia diclina VS20]EQC40963.1 hypothetical protein SDRG_02026 [Saprolegnia diclina VS20]|eukprot:XP_008605807.1 hypothetical protein SDRG_02026 [Saprolegnia diclina VS20]